MKPYQIFQALALRAKALEATEDESNDGSDRTTRLLVSASLELLKGIKVEIGSRDFDFDNEADKALLLKAVSDVDPTYQLNENETNCLAILGEHLIG